MVCGGFNCSKNSLVALNVLYIIVSFILIGVAAYSRIVAIITSLALVGGIIACGVFLFLISLVGLVGAVKHHQVLLFFYMIILFLLFLLQFSLACACLAVNPEQEVSLVKNGWEIADAEMKSSVQFHFNCCGFEDATLNISQPLGHPLCDAITCCKDSPAACCLGNSHNDTANETCPCQTCLAAIKPEIHKAFSVTGGVGLFFSFTEHIAVAGKNIGNMLMTNKISLAKGAISDPIIVPSTPTLEHS